MSTLQWYAAVEQQTPVLGPKTHQTHLPPAALAGTGLAIWTQGLRNWTLLHIAVSKASQFPKVGGWVGVVFDMCSLHARAHSQFRIQASQQLSPGIPLTVTIIQKALASLNGLSLLKCQTILEVLIITGLVYKDGWLLRVARCTTQ